jgi:hypothetical protein
MATKFEGLWRNTGKNHEGNDYDCTYQFTDTEFVLTDNVTGEEIIGDFTFDDKTITFSVFYLNKNWTQKYRLTDTCFELQTDSEELGGDEHWCGRFFKE